MKKAILTLAVAGMVWGASAQNKGRFETHEFDNFKLHVYYTNDALGDASYIVEGRNALVTMEQPLFKDNVAEFDAYLAGLAVGYWSDLDEVRSQWQVEKVFSPSGDLAKVASEIEGWHNAVNRVLTEYPIK